jgi:hypothetical protein
VRLWLERSARRSLWGRPIYRLTVGLVCEHGVLALIDRHRLYGDVVWRSPAAVALADAAEASFDTAGTVSLRWSDTSRALALNWRGLALARAAMDEAHVTVGDLLIGKTLEARHVGELLAAETGIRAGFDELARQLAALAGYEIGDEDRVRPQIETDAGVPARSWLRMARS